MTTIAWTRNYVTQEQLRRAYQRLGHTHSTPEWSATLLIDSDLAMAWACPILNPDALPGESSRYDWHVIAVAGELDWPPLRPEEEIWPALLQEHPVPTGERAEQKARLYAKSGSVEEMHREQLRYQFLGDAYISGSKRNPADVNFSPLVRDWNVIAQQLADFIDAHRPPKLTTEQRVMAQGVHLAQLEDEVERTKLSLGRLMRNAARDNTNKETGKLRPRFKTDITHWSGRSRPTVDRWLVDGGCCEGAVHDEDGTPHPQHSHEEV